MADFSPICEWVLRIEDSTLSGQIKDLGDGQGLTRFGVAQKSHPSLPTYFYTSSCSTIEALKIAEQVYREEYWNRFDGDHITYDEVASCLLSFAVNDGVSREVKMLQACLGLKQDGIMGPITLAATNQKVPWVVASCLRAKQASFYMSIPNNQKFINGWLRRASLVYPNL